MFLDGLFRLDCQGIDAGCDNTSWHSSAHKIESGITAAALLLTPLVLAFAFRRLPVWRAPMAPDALRDSRLIAASAVSSAYGPGVATRVASAVWFLWLALVAFHLLRTSGLQPSSVHDEGEGDDPPTPGSGPTPAPIDPLLQHRHSTQTFGDIPERWRRPVVLRVRPFGAEGFQHLVGQLGRGEPVRAQHERPARLAGSGSDDLIHAGHAELASPGPTPCRGEARGH